MMVPRDSPAQNIDVTASMHEEPVGRSSALESVFEEM
jgi:hypothetical protein